MAGYCWWVDRESDYAATARALLDAGVSPSSAEGLDAPLHLAARAGNAGVAKALCDAGAEVDAKTGAHSGSATALHIASARGDVAVMSVLLGAGAGLEVREGSDGLTPLQLAVQMGQEGGVRALLVAGASPHTRSAVGLSALHLAAQGGDAPILRLLLDAIKAAGAGAVGDAGGAGAGGAGGAGADAGGAGVASATASSSAPGVPSPLHLACYGGHHEAVSLLLAHRVGDAAAVSDASLDTPLHVAYRRGHARVVVLLLRAPSGQAAEGMRNARGQAPAEGAQQ